jgi:glycosyltransferase involved in cell wall biosynthesis
MTKKKSRLEALRAENRAKKEAVVSKPFISDNIRRYKTIEELKDSLHIAVYLMVKNEEKRICVSLDSVKSIIKSVVIFDTGSTDNTISVIREWCEKAGVELRLKEGVFVDFSTSRNEGLAFADTFMDIDYILMLDSNDELKSPVELINICSDYKNTTNTGFMLCQEWFFGESTTKYFNVRLIKPRSNWWYKGVIHEYINRYTSNTLDSEVINGDELVKCGDVIIYQDRIADEGKSIPRYKRDKELLLREVEKNPKDSRSMFYLAQTCECLNEPEDALYYYRLRTMLNGFEEERFQAFVRCGDNAMKIGHDPEECVGWFMKAYCHSRRAEPLVKIANIYHKLGKVHMASMFLREACSLPFPSDAILFVDRRTYDYERHHKMGIVGWYSGHFLEGKIGCLNAIKSTQGSDVDKSNLAFYTNREKEVAPKTPKTIYMSEKLRETVMLFPQIEWKDMCKMMEEEYARIKK